MSIFIYFLYATGVPAHQLVLELNMCSSCTILSRNTNDSTITLADKKRDYYVTLDGLLCVGGEDKTSRAGYQALSSFRL